MGKEIKYNVQVKSSRKIKVITTENQRDVFDLVCTLKTRGYDVDIADIMVISPVDKKEGIIRIGDLKDYVIQDNDIVCLSTRTVENHCRISESEYRKDPEYYDKLLKENGDDEDDENLSFEEILALASEPVLKVNILDKKEKLCVYYSDGKCTIEDVLSNAALKDLFEAEGDELLNALTAYNGVKTPKEWKLPIGRLSLQDGDTLVLDREFDMCDLDFFKPEEKSTSEDEEAEETHCCHRRRFARK